jgi:hypothetical protein
MSIGADTVVSQNKVEYRESQGGPIHRRCARYIGTYGYQNPSGVLSRIPAWDVPTCHTVTSRLGTIMGDLISWVTLYHCAQGWGLASSGRDELHI